MHAGRHKQDGPDVPVEVDPRNNLFEEIHWRNIECNHLLPDWKQSIVRCVI